MQDGQEQKMGGVSVAAFLGAVVLIFGLLPFVVGWSVVGGVVPLLNTLGFDVEPAPLGWAESFWIVVTLVILRFLRR